MFVDETAYDAHAVAVLQRTADEFVTTAYHRKRQFSHGAPRAPPALMSQLSWFIGLDGTIHAALMSYLIKRFTSTIGTYEKDITQYLWVAAYFLRYFHVRRQQQLQRLERDAAAADAGSSGAAAASSPSPWAFGFVGTSLELDTVRFAVSKIRDEYLSPEAKVSVPHTTASESETRRWPSASLALAALTCCDWEKGWCAVARPAALDQRPRGRAVLARDGTRCLPRRLDTAGVPPPPYTRLRADPGGWAACAVGLGKTSSWWWRPWRATPTKRRGTSPTTCSTTSFTRTS